MTTLLTRTKVTYHDLEAIFELFTLIFNETDKTSMTRHESLTRDNNIVSSVYGVPKIFVFPLSETRNTRFTLNRAV